MASPKRKTMKSASAMPMQDTYVKKMILLLGLGLVFSIIITKTMTAMNHPEMTLLEKMKFVLVDGMVAPLIITLWVLFQLYKVTCVRDGGCNLLATLLSVLVLFEVVFHVILFINM